MKPEMNKPLAIVVCGRPGSGKTVLAHELAKIIRCPVISRDELKEGYIHAAGKGHDEISGEEIRNINDAFFDTIKLLADYEITLIAEAAFQHKMWAARYESLSEKVSFKIIVCETDKITANKRFLKRRAADPLREYFHGDTVINGANDDYEYEAPRFSVPLMNVDTTDGYKPALDEIVSFIGSGPR